MPCPSCRPSSRSPQCSTAPKPGGSALQRSSARTSTSTGPTGCSSSSVASSPAAPRAAFAPAWLSEGVVPCRHVPSKHSKIKQYHRAGAAHWDDPQRHLRLRSRQTAVQSACGSREIGFSAHRRLLDVQALSHDCSMGAERFAAVIRPRCKTANAPLSCPVGRRVSWPSCRPWVCSPCFPVGLEAPNGAP
jgi:hypothetical protein